MYVSMCNAIKKKKENVVMRLLLERPDGDIVGYVDERRHAYKVDKMVYTDQSLLTLALEHECSTELFRFLLERTIDLQGLDWCPNQYVLEHATKQALRWGPGLDFTKLRLLLEVPSRMDPSTLYILATYTGMLWFDHPLEKDLHARVEFFAWLHHERKLDLNALHPCKMYLPDFTKPGWYADGNSITTNATFLGMILCKWIAKWTPLGLRLDAHDAITMQDYCSFIERLQQRIPGFCAEVVFPAGMTSPPFTLDAFRRWTLYSPSTITGYRFDAQDGWVSFERHKYDAELITTHIVLPETKPENMPNLQWNFWNNYVHIAKMIRLLQISPVIPLLQAVCIPRTAQRSEFQRVPIELIKVVASMFLDKN